MAEPVLTEQQKQLLNLIQTDFPIVEEPYAVLGESLGCTAEEALALLRGLVDDGWVRRVGCFFETSRLGLVGMLAAVKVEPARLADVAAFINQFVEVTHNYERQSDHQLWFTLSAPSLARRDAILEAVRQAPGVIDLRLMPPVKRYKVNVQFELE